MNWIELNIIKQSLCTVYTKAIILSFVKLIFYFCVEKNFTWKYNEQNVILNKWLIAFFHVFFNVISYYIIIFFLRDVNIYVKTFAFVEVSKKVDLFKLLCNCWNKFISINVDLSKVKLRAWRFLVAILIDSSYNKRFFRFNKNFAFWI